MTSKISFPLQNKDECFSMTTAFVCLFFSCFTGSYDLQICHPTVASKCKVSGSCAAKALPKDPPTPMPSHPALALLGLLSIYFFLKPQNSTYNMVFGGIIPWLVSVVNRGKFVSPQMTSITHRKQSPKNPISPSIQWRHFEDPPKKKPAKYRFKLLYRRVQWFLEETMMGFITLNCSLIRPYFLGVMKPSLSLNKDSYFLQERIPIKTKIRNTMDSMVILWPRMSKKWCALSSQLGDHFPPGPHHTTLHQELEMELRRVLQGFHEKLDDLHPLSGTISHWHGGCFCTTQTTEGEFIWPHIHLQDVRIANKALLLYGLRLPTAPYSNKGSGPDPNTFQSLSLKRHSFWQRCDGLPLHRHHRWCSHSDISPKG